MFDVRPYGTKSDFLQKLLLNPATIITTLTAVFYFNGQALYSGRLSYWGLSTNLFPLSFQDTLTEGALGYVQVGLDKWQYLAGLAFLWAIMYAIVFMLVSNRFQFIILRIVNTKRVNDFQKYVLDEASNILLMVCMVLGLVLIIFIFSYWSFQKGESLAATAYKNMHSAKGLHSSYKTATIDYLGDKNVPVTVSGALIATSSTLFALNTPKDDMVLIPASRLVSVRYHGGGKEIAK